MNWEIFFIALPIMAVYGVFMFLLGMKAGKEGE